MPWYDSFDSVFFLATLTGLCGGIGLCLRFAARTKCSSLKCCFGVVDIVRDVRAEEQLEEARLMQTARQGSRESPSAGGISQKNSANGFSTPPSPMPGGVVLNRM